ncbi:MAG: excinuclease ABC subunit UvrB [Helicobacteraceae bacterium]|jgi:excinuclease ABC subunit B|nr:excinuclease ABC subunit UvrB [Helicobacteraceae bacterium]
MPKFQLNSEYKAAGDQPQAIEQLANSIKNKNRYQTLLGVTGSGKTFTMASVIERLQTPALIMTHNKTLAAQLFHEFKGFFPKNRVEYFISYYDYYQPEAYIPRQDLFIEKDSAINDELERLRLSTTASLMHSDDVIVIASVSANYGLGSPEEYREMISRVKTGDELPRREWLLRLVDMGYKRNDNFFERGNIRVTGEAVEVFPTYTDNEAVRVEFFGDEAERILLFHPYTGEIGEKRDQIVIYAATNFVVRADRLAKAIASIESELETRLCEFEKAGKIVEYQRLKQRVEFDLEMLRATGSCKGVENYSRHFTLKKPGETPYTMMDYFEGLNKPYLVIVDESHVSLPQFRGMFAGDRSRKEVLVEYGFRLPSALDNRPLMFDEFINKAPHYLFVSATPAEWEISHSRVVAEQVVRPTGLLDPTIELHSSENQVAILYDEAKKAISRGDRVLVTTLTKKMAEELQKHYVELGLRVRYLHSDIDAIERNEIIRGLRGGAFDILIGINLLREGLDLPEVSLVAIFDADKEGFLRSETALIQTMGRAARNLNGKVLMFCRKESEAMKAAIATTKARREKQTAFNAAHNITPQSVSRKMDETLHLDDYKDIVEVKREKLMKMPAAERQKLVAELSKKMQLAAKSLEFEEAARLRDEIAKIRAL